MYCTNCGKQIGESNFCQNCGAKNGTINIDTQQSNNHDKILFQSQNWERTRVFAFSVLRHIDVIITEKFLYLIPLPKSLTHDIAGVFGVLGFWAAKSAENKAHNKFRSSISQSEEYEETALLKIPKSKITESVMFKKFFRQNLAIFNYDGKNITLQNKKGSYIELKEYINSNINRL